MDKVLSTWDVVNWKVCLLLIFIYLLINSEIFIDNVLSSISGAVRDDTVATFGTMIQSAILGGSYLVFQPLATYDYI